MANLSAGNYLAGSVSQNIAKFPSSLVGIFIAAATGGQITVYDDGGTGTALNIVPQFTPAAATWYPFPVQTTRGINLVIGGTVTYMVAWD